MNKNNKKGFTLAELLIVVAIIGVLVAVSIPIFTAQLKKAKLATNQANARAGYAACVAALLENNMSEGTCVYSVANGVVSSTPTSATTGGSLSTAISSWAVTDNAGVVLGDETANTWTVVVTSSGSSYTAAK